MTGKSDSTPTRHSRHVPPLPRRLAEPTPVVLGGTIAWFTGFAVLGVQGWTSGGFSVGFWTSLVGWVLGLIGYGVFRWQRSAARRGARGAWKGLSGLDN